MRCADRCVDAGEVLPLFADPATAGEWFHTHGRRFRAIAIPHPRRSHEGARHRSPFPIVQDVDASLFIGYSRGRAFQRTGRIRRRQMGNTMNNDLMEGDGAELVTLCDSWYSAIISINAECIAKFMADDWVIVSESGISSKTQFLSYVISGELTHSAMDRAGEARVRVYGDTAVFTARVTSTAHYGGKQFDADEWTTRGSPTS